MSDDLTVPDPNPVAWSKVLRGYEEALQVPGLSPADVGVLRRQRACCAQLAGVRSLAVVGDAS